MPQPTPNRISVSIPTAPRRSSGCTIDGRVPNTTPRYVTTARVDVVPHVASAPANAPARTQCTRTSGASADRAWPPAGATAVAGRGRVRPRRARTSHTTAPAVISRFTSRPSGTPSSVSVSRVDESIATPTARQIPTEIIDPAMSAVRKTAAGYSTTPQATAVARRTPGTMRPTTIAGTPPPRSRCSAPARRSCVRPT